MKSMPAPLAGRSPAPGAGASTSVTAGRLLALLGLALLLAAGALRIGPLPALGPLLDPVHGLWSVARQARRPLPDVSVIAGLDGAVDVVVDARGVPHVYATTVLDAVRALGYLQATDRLFQLELQWRATAGRLTELIGERALELDRQQRRLGMRRAAELAWRELDDGSPDRALYQALADGINARMDALGRAGMPFEYHFLGKPPSPWEPVNSLLVEKRMAYTLSYSTDDLWRLRVEGLVGKAAADALYPVDSPLQQPVQPNGSPLPTRLPHSVPPPLPRNAGVLRAAEELLAAVPPPPAVPDDIVLGSNNWAVAGSRTTTGGALLAGDPHLNLTLPSIWYEVHLVVPGELDVHGVTIPGVPGVIIGFTPRVAWSVTNNHADVVDFYRETVDDATAPSSYLLDDEWVALERREERYYGRDGEILAEEMHHFTHRGPLRQTPGAGALSMRWLALEQGASASSFFRAARAATVDELMDAFAGFASPAQNFVMADASGRIAIRSTGLYPVRPSPAGGAGGEPGVAGDGRVIRDGTRTASDWTGYWPLRRYPQAVDPAQGYLASANQQPVDPRDEPAYLGNNWTSPWRALRINELLRGSRSVAVEDMRAWQTDPGNAKAASFAPAFVDAVAAAPDAELRPAAELLAAWDHRYEATAEAPLLLEHALDALEALLWDELDFEAAVAEGLPPAPKPREVVLLSLLDEPDSAWWDDRQTPEREDRDVLLRRALEIAWDELNARHGAPGRGAWAWSLHRRANIHHLARFPGLGRLGLALAGGGPGNLNPSSGSGTHGASWRMVVDLDPAAGVSGFGVYPGGQSGNPASARYDDRLTTWQRGELARIDSPPRPDAARRMDGAVAVRLVPGPAR